MYQNIIKTSIFLLIIAEAQPQFFDFLGFPPIVQHAKYGDDYTTRRTKVDTIKTVHGTNSHITWKNTTISIVYEGVEREDSGNNNNYNNKRKNNNINPPILNFNLFTTTPKPKKVKVTSNSSRRRNNNNSQNNNNNNGGQNSRITDSRNNNRYQSELDTEIIKTRQENNNWFDKPVNTIQDYYTERTYETTKNYNNYYTTKNPFHNRPGVRPPIPETNPPITNRPATKRPTDHYRPATINYRPGTINYRPTEASRPITQRPIEIKTTRRPDNPTVRPYIVNPYPTDAGALVFPHEDEVPEVLTGPDEEYMSDVEKRRYIDIAEKMCDKYKSLNTKHIQAIPLLPSPDPVQVNVSKCTPTTIPLVVGGKVVSIGEFPHMALLGWIKLETGGYSWKCGGSLISDQYVLTAAHCSFQERDNTVITGPPRVVQLGSSYLDDPGALVVRVAAVVRHPKYKFPKSYYDVALLKLVQKVTFSDVIKPACLGVPPPVGEPIIATGWGKTELGGDQSLELRSVSLPVWDMYKCHEVLGTSRKMPDGPSSDSQMCAGDARGGKDTCQGDSGGPAQIQDGCAWRVVAVTSLGRSCGAPNTPGLYALVHRVFIAAQVFGDHNRNNRNSNDRNKQEKTTESYHRQPNYDNNDNNRATENYHRQNNNDNNNNNRATESYNGHNNNNNDRTTESYNRQNNYDNNNNRATENYNNNGQRGFTNQQNLDTVKHNDRPTYDNQNRYSRNNNRESNNNYGSNNNYYSQNNNHQRDNSYTSNNDNENYYLNNNNGRNNNHRTLITERFEEGRVWFT